ncbi:class I SAM-dependent methyltransferase [Gimesia aquarii]|uniref:Methyltransferase domain protein n=1 Tax=Gimesia aquarii TaxID=2527964 RepID=A0A517WZR9_9PLAN|nr:class I SAM-dependent methyltransferase [Gimesia aquarii]QDU10749.1 Methyltransferase domain protein [Gimesia aquarii]
MKIDNEKLKSLFSKLGISQKYGATQWALNLWDEFGALESGDTVVDLGCGERFAPAMSLDPTIHYIGFDVNRDSVEKGSLNYPQYRWKHSNVRNEMYNPTGVIDPKTFQIPIEENVADLVICASLFSHLETFEVAKNYIHEIQRIIKPDGHIWISWFRSPPNEVCSDAKRTVFTEAEIINMIGGWLDLKLTIGGMTEDYHNQWIMLGQVKSTNEFLAKAS